MRQRFFGLLVAVFVLQFFGPLVGGTNALSIRPLRQAIQLKPGQTTPKSLTVTNTSKTPETVRVHATSFKTIDKHYNYGFGAPPDLSSWVQLIEEQALLQPGQQHTFNYNIAVPNEAEPGGKYMAIFASISSQAKTNDKTKNVVERAGSLIYLVVTGQQTKQGKLLSFTTPIISFSKSNSWTQQIQNRGNTHFESQTNLSLSKWLGWKPDKASENHLILPGTIRELSGKYELGNWPGIYRLAASVSLGDNSNASQTRWILYLPPLPSLALGISLAIFISLMVRKLGRKKRTRRFY